MRRLGSELGVEGMALYHYVAGRDELEAAIAERLLEPLRRLKPTRDWREACGGFAGALRTIAKARPATFLLVGLRPLDTPALLAPVEALLGTLVACGFPASDALAVYRAVASYARGYALAEATGFTVDAARAAGRERLRALHPDAFPILAGRSQQLSCLDPDRASELGLQALLDGLPSPAEHDHTDAPAFARHAASRSRERVAGRRRSTGWAIADAAAARGIGNDRCRKRRPLPGSSRPSSTDPGWRRSRATSALASSGHRICQSGRRFRKGPGAGSR